MMNAMPKTDGILETALYVEDVERSVQFYRILFGFEVIESSPRLSALAVAPRQVLLLFKKGASVNLSPGATDASGQLHLAFAIPASELAAWEAWLKKQGLEIEERKSWERGGQSLYFRDPDQHLLELATPGVWSNY
jgi:catechol 2,3-dioxygenase-like lactoylglutathione lyase family enzyme